MANGGEPITQFLRAGISYSLEAEMVFLVNGAPIGEGTESETKTFRLQYDNQIDRISVATTTFDAVIYRIDSLGSGWTDPNLYLSWQITH